jgi:hypothetical protein
VTLLKQGSAGRVLDYWFAWAGEKFMKKMINAYKDIIATAIKSQDESTHKYSQQILLKSSMNFLQKLHKVKMIEMKVLFLVY